MGEGCRPAAKPVAPALPPERAYWWRPRTPQPPSRRGSPIRWPPLIPPVGRPTYLPPVAGSIARDPIARTRSVGPSSSAASNPPSLHSPYIRICGYMDKHTRQGFAPRRDPRNFHARRRCSPALRVYPHHSRILPPRHSRHPRESSPPGARRRSRTPRTRPLPRTWIFTGDPPHARRVTFSRRHTYSFLALAFRPGRSPQAFAGYKDR